MAVIKQIVLPDGNTYDVAIEDMVGATAQKAGTGGAVPAPAISDKDKFLKGDGSWSGYTFSVDLTTGNLMYE